MIYHAFVTLENDQVISVLKRVSRANNKEVWEFAAFAHTEELERFDEYAWPYFEGGEASHWRERFLTGETSTQVFEGVPLAELKDYFSEIGIKSYRAVLNREGFERDFRIF
jgi:hypothetical protein